MMQDLVNGQAKHLNQTRPANELGCINPTGYFCFRRASCWAKKLRPEKCENCKLKHPDLSDLPNGWCRAAVTGSLVTLSIALCKMPSPSCLCFPATQGVRVRSFTCCTRNIAAVEKVG